MSTITNEGRAIRSNIRTGVVLVVMVMIALVVVALFADDEAVGGPDGSSFVTTDLGTAALAELLEELGAETVRSRTPLTAAALEPVDTMLALGVAEGGYGRSELTAVGNAVRAGMTLILAGRPNDALLGSVVDEPVTWSASTALSGRNTIGDAQLAAGRFGVFQPGPGLPISVSSDDDLVVLFGVGEGQLILFSDISMLANTNLDELDNAAFAVEMIGTGRVLFDELRHGYAESGTTGFAAAAPDNWRNAVYLLGFVALVGLVVYGRRLGPAEPHGRTFVPGRDQLIRSVAVTLRRRNSPVEATAGVRDLAKHTIQQRSLLGPEPTERELRSAGSQFLDEAELAAIFEPTPDTVLAADRALARLGNIDGGRE